MTTITRSTLGERWVALAPLGDDERQAGMRRIFDELLTMAAAKRSAAFIEMVDAEYTLNDRMLRPFTTSRLRAWLSLASERPDDARVIADSYDEVFNQMPIGIAMRRITIVQTVARTELSAAEIVSLLHLFPALGRQIPFAPVAMAEHVAGHEPSGEPPPRWKFWLHRA